ncbi:hypothetical protein KVT40_003317 [Elsinoe batatas]|uniref:Ubiquitin-like modifier HUB1 n=1 Tax=Elsinoe batatas TaxID=2601811 RepID=A0A8K0L5A2_9PEZI|nr:hypothetical protein KVT40_003317 [Elsinoe batatas]
MARSRSRSRSPERPRKSKGGFKWKDKSSKDTTSSDLPSKSNYRERSPKYDTRPRDRSSDRTHERRRSRSRERRRHSDRDTAYREDRYLDRESTRRAPKADSKETPTTSQPTPDPAPASAPPVVDKTSIAAKFGAKAASAARKPPPSSNSTPNPSAPAPASDLPPVRPPAPEKQYKMPSANEPMIIVHINDRLGTKAAIPCLASDPVKAFKAMVAARIGRQPHEIMLKRQGERPFKDQLTLEDYGVSNGVQLDLELDTGD